jgi:hypothetical protein
MQRRKLLSRTAATCLAEVQWTLLGLWLLGLMTVLRLIGQGIDRVHVSFCAASHSGLEAHFAPITRVAMERQAGELQERRARWLHEAAEVAVALDRANGTIPGVPHYSVIELRAPERGQQLSRHVQQRPLETMVLQQAPRVACPGCGTSCQMEPVQRTVTSIDGSVPLPELRGACPRCRRAFFPPPGAAGLRCPRRDAGGGPEDHPDGGPDPVVRPRRAREGRSGGPRRLGHDHRTGGP